MLFLEEFVEQCSWSLSALGTRFWFWLLASVALFSFNFLFKTLCWLRGEPDYWSKRGIPGPKATPFFGHYWALRLPGKGSIRQLREWTREYGPVYGLMDGARRLLVVSDPNTVHELLVTKFDLFEARKLNVLSDEHSVHNSGSILHATSFRWKRLRGIAGAFFNAINICKIVPIVAEISEDISEELRKELRLVSADAIIDLQPLVQLLTDRLFMRIAFGEQATNNSSSARTNNCAAYADIMPEEMLMALNARGGRVERLFALMAAVLPCTRTLINALNKARFRPASNAAHNARLFARLSEEVTAARKNKMSKAVASLGGDSFGEFSFLNHLLQAEVSSDGDTTDNAADGAENEKQEHEGKLLQTTKITKKLGTRYLQTNEIVSACINFLYAGHKTSARALLTVLYCLAQHPDVQEQLYNEEIADFSSLEGNGSNDEAKLTFEHFERMELLGRCIREALRLFPLGADHVSRRAMATTSLGEYTSAVSGDDSKQKKNQFVVPVEAGVCVMVDVLSMHMDPALWGPNPECFCPSRWLHLSPGTWRQVQFLSFGQGPRQCMGEKFAMLQLKVALVVLLRRFRFISTGKTTTTLMIDSLPVRVEPREKENKRAFL